MGSALATPQLREVTVRIARKYGVGISGWFGEVSYRSFGTPVAAKKDRARSRGSARRSPITNLRVLHVADRTPEMEVMVDRNDPEQNSGVGRRSWRSPPGRARCGARSRAGRPRQVKQGEARHLRAGDRAGRRSEHATGALSRSAALDIAHGEAEQPFALVPVGSEIDELALRPGEHELSAPATSAGGALVHEHVDADRGEPPRQRDGRNERESLWPSAARTRSGAASRSTLPRCGGRPGSTRVRARAASPPRDHRRRCRAEPRCREWRRDRCRTGSRRRWRRIVARREGLRRARAADRQRDSIVTTALGRPASSQLCSERRYAASPSSRRNGSACVVRLDAGFRALSRSRGCGRRPVRRASPELDDPDTARVGWPHSRSPTRRSSDDADVPCHPPAALSASPARGRSRSRHLASSTRR